MARLTATSYQKKKRLIATWSIDSHFLSSMITKSTGCIDA